MDGIVINISPVLLQIGHFSLRWYSLAIILAVTTAVLITTRQGPKKGISSDEIYSLAFWAVLGGIVGARLFHVIDRWDYYGTNPLQILAFQQGGLAIWGALAGGAAAVIPYAKIKHLPLSRLVDTITPGLLVAQIIGRFGCIVNGDAYGDITSLPWGFIYLHPDALIRADLFGQPTHPYPVYEIIWNAIALLIIWQVGRRTKINGSVFLSYLMLYSVGRFFLTFVRQEKIWFWGLQEAQVIAIVTLITSAAVLIYLWNKEKAKPPLEANPEPNPRD